MKINIITLGCSKNTVDSENVAGHLVDAGYKVYFDRQQNDCDCTLVNTCGFIGDAKEESVQAILEQMAVKQRARKPKKLFVFGCLVERYKADLQTEMPEVDGWFGVNDWQRLVGMLAAVDDSFVLQHSRRCSTPSHYAYLKIAEGCNRSCSYCAIPGIRGSHRSRPIDDIVNEARQLVSSGVKELIVIAQDTTYYGLDLYGERKLGALLTRLATESGTHWIRLHYTYPASFPLDAIQAIRTHHNICNYIDIPLQHINSNILSSMRRGINREETLSLLQHFRNELPDAAVRTTLIVGYPGETEADFEELKKFVAEVRFDRMGCFAYSPEEGTPAEALGDPIPDEEKQRRVGELMAVQEQVSLEKNEAKIGKTFEVLVDRQEGEYFIGRTEYDSPDVDDEVLVPYNDDMQIGEFYNIKIVDAMENDLIGEWIR